MTVAGRVAAAELGVTLIHEHLIMDTRRVLDHVHGYESGAGAGLADPAEARWNPGAFRENYDLSDAALAISELSELAGSVGTIVDCTPMDIGRDPAGLLRIAAHTGLHIVMGAGWYLHGVRTPRYRAMTAEQMAELLVREFREGVGETGVRPGILGEIGTSDPVDEEEAKVLRAAAAASRQTGLAVTVHLHPWSKHGLRVAQIMESAGMAMDKLILNHLTTAHDDIAYTEALLARGCYLAFDLFGFDHSLLAVGRYPPSDYDVAGSVVRLIRDGHARRLLISMDIGVRTRLRTFGGWGFGHLTRHVMPLLTSLGASAADLAVMLVENPRDVLGIATADAGAAPAAV
jgi:phosphotriesterase-related protein